MNDPLKYIIKYLQEQLNCEPSIRFYINTNNKQLPMLRIYFPQYPCVALALPISQIETAINLFGLEGACEKLADDLMVALIRYRQTHPEQFE